MEYRCSILPRDTMTPDTRDWSFSTCGSYHVTLPPPQIVFIKLGSSLRRAMGGYYYEIIWSSLAPPSILSLFFLESEFSQFTNSSSTKQKVLLKENKKRDYPKKKNRSSKKVKILRDSGQGIFSKFFEGKKFDIFTEIFHHATFQKYTWLPLMLTFWE